MNSTVPFIPLVDLKAQHQSIRDEVNQAVATVLDRCDFVLGASVFRFEEKFAEFCGTRHCVTVGSGTDAIHLACRAFGVGPGDEVILPAFTFVATALGVTLAGARPVLVDVDRDTALIDVKKIEESLTPRTKAIIPVHLYGQCADMCRILDLARDRGYHVIEDAAQAHGAAVMGKRAGSLGDAGCFSFFPSKNLGACGDGGGITTNHDDIAERLKLLRNWGASKKYHHDEMGMNSRTDTLQAAIMLIKLSHLDRWNTKRRELASVYAEGLSSIPGVTVTRARADSIFHLYTVRVKDRDGVLQKLQKAGLGAGVHYPFAVHEQKAYAWLGYRVGDFPEAECWARETLSLPMYAEMPREAIMRVIEVLRS